jgi:hypothetical protein
MVAETSAVEPYGYKRMRSVLGTASAWWDDRTEWKARYGEALEALSKLLAEGSSSTVNPSSRDRQRARRIIARSPAATSASNW